MPQLDTSTWPTQLIWLAITFCALYYIISRVVIPRTGGVIARRKAQIEGDLASAQALKRDTDKAIETYEAQLAEARAKATQISQDNRNRLNSEIDGERAKLDAALGVRIGEAEKTVQAARTRALADIGEVAADIAASIVSELTGTRVTKAMAAEAVSKAAK